MASNQYDLEIIIRTKKQGDGLEQVNKSLADTRTQMGQTAQSVDSGGLKWTEFASKLSVAKVAFGAVAGAAKVVYDQIDQGAQLQAAENRFNNLAKSIGTTATALEGELAAATKGMVANSALIASATDIISLGLAKDEEGVTRLATVISGLGLDMQQVILTFANNSAARLDALGLSVEGVRLKAAELEAQGFEGDAFDEAVLIGLEEKMALFGDASETTAGQLSILKAEAQNAKDEVAEFFATISAPVIENLAKSTSTYQQELHATALEIASTAKNSEDLRNIINKQFGEGEDLFRQAEEMGLAYIDLGHGQSVWIDDLERASGYSLPRFGQELEKLNQLSREYSVVTGTTAVGAASDYGAELARLSQMGQEAAASSRDNIDAIEAEAKARREAFIGFFQEASDPVNELLDAQQALSDSQGEWVTRTVSSADQVAAVNAQLASDLSDDQAKAYREILRTVDEGSAEWLDAYNRLQNDLSQSQRDALVAQQADLASQPDRLVDVYTGDSAAAEEAQARITAANEAIKQSYRETAAEALLAQAAQNGNLAETLDVLVGIGYLSQAQADAQLEIANTNQAIQDLTASQTYSRLTTEEQTAALNALIEGTAQTADQAINLAEQQTAVNDALNAMPKAVVSTVTIRGLEDADTRIGDILRQLDALDGRNVSANVTVNTSTAQDLGNGGGGKEPPKKAAGGSVFAGGLFQAGEGNLPELLRQKDGRLFIIPGDDGQVFSNQQSQGMLGGGGSYVDRSQTIIYNRSKEAAAMTQALINERRKQRRNQYMGVS
ncbi:MAG: hypothetical protein IT327_07840 [Anaerolineae bacterium]|nr:hypothetical protein [Anaerolineae bacterium]